MLYDQFYDIKSQQQKVGQRLIVGRAYICHNLGHNESFMQYVLSHMRPFLFGYHISLCFFCTQSGEGSWFLDTFENVLANIWPTSISMEESNSKWWNEVISGIDTHGN